MDSEPDSVPDLLRVIEALKTFVAEGENLGDEILPASNILPSPFLENPEGLFPVLCAHAQERVDGRIMVTAPITTLQGSALLLPTEARTILDALAAKGYLTGDGIWEEATIAKDRYIPPERKDPKAVVESLRQATSRRIRYDWRTLAYPKLDQIVPAPRAPRVEASKQTLPQIYGRLVERSVVIDGKRLMRGVVPFLQTEMKIGPSDAIKILEFLERGGHVAKLDGWSVIRLVTSPAREVGAMTIVDPTRSHVILEVPPFPVTISGDEDTSIVLDKAIALLEKRFAALQTVSREMAERVATLEQTLGALRAARDEHRAQEGDPTTLLARIREMWEEIASVLRIRGA